MTFPDFVRFRECDGYFGLAGSICLSARYHIACSDSTLTLCVVRLILKGQQAVRRGNDYITEVAIRSWHCYVLLTI